jgi:hypothetical protein
MNETKIHDLLAQAYNLLAAEWRSRRPNFQEPMDEIARLFDPKGAINTPTRMVALDPVIQQAVRDIREIMKQFRDRNCESIEQTARDLWVVLSRREVVSELRAEAEYG